MLTIIIISLLAQSLCSSVVKPGEPVVQAGKLMVVDPNLEEEAAAAGLMTVIMNAFGELCALQKTSGIGLPAPEVHPPSLSHERQTSSLTGLTVQALNPSNSSQGITLDRSCLRFVTIYYVQPYKVCTIPRLTAHPTSLGLDRKVRYNSQHDARRLVLPRGPTSLQHKHIELYQPRPEICVLYVLGLCGTSLVD